MSIQDMGDEELLSDFAEAHQRLNSSRGDTYDRDEYEGCKTELLRRLSAGNPQDEKVQITEECCGIPKCATHDKCVLTHLSTPECKAKRSDGRIGHGKVLPVESDIEERSDGRIQAQRQPATPCGWCGGELAKETRALHLTGACRSGEQSETRIQDRKLTPLDPEFWHGFWRGTSVERAKSDVYDVAKRVIQHAVAQDESKIKP